MPADLSGVAPHELIDAVRSGEPIECRRAAEELGRRGASPDAKTAIEGRLAQMESGQLDVLSIALCKVAPEEPAVAERVFGLWSENRVTYTATATGLAWLTLQAREAVREPLGARLASGRERDLLLGVQVFGARWVVAQPEGTRLLKEAAGWPSARRRRLFAVTLERSPQCAERTDLLKRLRSDRDAEVQKIVTEALKRDAWR